MEQANRTDLEARLAIAKEKATAARGRREELENKGAFEREVLKAELDASDQDALANIEEEHGTNKIATVETDMGLIVVKRCGAMRYKRFQDQETTKTKEVEALVRPCVIHPSKARFDSILEELPATLTRCANAIAILAGIRSKSNQGKD